MKCPKCAGQIAFDATSHPTCGWNVRQAAQDAPGAASLPCAHSGCPNPAIVAVRLPTGWAGLCKHHDLFHVQLEADEFCREKGLTTLKQKREYAQAAMKEFGKTDPAKHWQKVLDTPGLPEPSYRMAREALKRLHIQQPE